MDNVPTLTVSEFVAVLNQTLEYAFSSVEITGELANFKVSKSRWVYFDLKDDEATVRFFGTVYQLPGPLEDGMMLTVSGAPRLHAQYGFSVQIRSMRPVGEGSIKKAHKLLEMKLEAEGLFAPERKRSLPYPPGRIGLITSSESAAYHDFIKVLNARWGGVAVVLADVQVQGEAAVPQIVQAIEQFNQQAEPPEVLIITRGGGSAEDLQAFSTEQVTRAVAASRIPTIVAIGHEVDLSLAERAADQRASTPSNAAELLVPDRKAVLEALINNQAQLHRMVVAQLQAGRQNITQLQTEVKQIASQTLQIARDTLTARHNLLRAFDPAAALQRGYALVKQGTNYLRSGAKLKNGEELAVELADAHLTTQVKQVTMK